MNLFETFFGKPDEPESKKGEIKIEMSEAAQEKRKATYDKRSLTPKARKTEMLEKEVKRLKAQVAVKDRGDDE